MEPTFLSSEETQEYWRYMFAYKTVACAQAACAAADCWDFHSPAEQRRIPVYTESTKRFNYLPRKCDLKKCSGSDCAFSHNLHEINYHPLLFKVKQCNGTVVNGQCGKFGAHCPYAHSTELVRRPELLYPMDERVWVKKEKREEVKTEEKKEERKEGSSNTELFAMSQEQGALEAKLKSLEANIKRKKAAEACRQCKSQPRTSLFNPCGHGFCVECAQQSAQACSICGQAGSLLALKLG